MALIPDIEMIKLEPLEVKLEPPAIKLEQAVIKWELPDIKLESLIKSEPSDEIEYYPADIVHSSDLVDEAKKIDISESKFAVDEDGCRNNKFFATEFNFNKQVLSHFDDDNLGQSNSSEKVDWAKIYRTRPTTNCLDDQNKVMKVYESSWKKPIQPEEYTCMSKTSFICNACHREYKSMRNLGAHIRRHHRESSIIYHCPYCPKKSKWNLRSHILRKHKDENEVNWFQCYECGKKFCVKGRLVKHLQMHKRQSSATCSICGRVFISGRGMRNHIKNNHEGEKTVYQCEKCSFSALYASALKRHIEVYHMDPNELPIHECSKCVFKTRYKHLYVKHCKGHENSDFKYFCDKCAFMTRSYAELNKHAKVHKTKTIDESLKYYYYCKECDFKSHSPQRLQAHEEKHLKPEEIKFFYCYHCGFKANRKHNLKNHILVHFKRHDVTFQCFMCDFETNKRDSLMEHMNHHQKSSQVKAE